MLSLKSERIPRATIRRLAVYVQVLESMQRNGVEVISSGPLAEACDVNARTLPILANSVCVA